MDSGRMTFKQHRAPRLSQQFLCRIVIRQLFIRKNLFFFQLALSQLELAWCLLVCEHNVVRTRKLTHDYLAFPLEFTPAGKPGGGFLALNDSGNLHSSSFNVYFAGINKVGEAYKFGMSSAIFSDRISQWSPFIVRGSAPSVDTPIGLFF